MSCRGAVVAGTYRAPLPGTVLHRGPVYKTCSPLIPSAVLLGFPERSSRAAQAGTCSPLKAVTKAQCFSREEQRGPAPTHLLPSGNRYTQPGLQHPGTGRGSKGSRTPPWLRRVGAARSLAVWPTAKVGRSMGVCYPPNHSARPPHLRPIRRLTAAAIRRLTAADRPTRSKRSALHLHCRTGNSGPTNLCSRYFQQFAAGFVAVFTPL
jgi:hypothetical protein